MTIYNMMAWAGFYVDKLFPHFDGFWSTPVGLLTAFSIFVCAVINVYHKGIDDSWFDRIWYCAIAIVMLCAFLAGINPETDPRHIVRMTTFLIAIKMLVEVIVRLRRYHRTGKCQKTT